MVEQLSIGLQNAGSSYSMGENLSAIFVVDSRPFPDNRNSVARIKIDGVERELDWISLEGARRTIYARGEYAVHLSDSDDDPVTCLSSECEGTFDTGNEYLTLWMHPGSTAH